jgi:eukaryotic-like serine/threonine-protein kinase
MPEIDIEMLVDQLTLIGLVSREQYREARAEAENGSGEALVRILMRKGWLTSWQLERLKKGCQGLPGKAGAQRRAGGHQSAA